MFANYLYAMKRVHPVPLYATGRAHQIRQETFLTSILCRSGDIHFAGETIGTVFGSAKIGATCPSKDLVEIILTMQFLPNYMRTFLNKVREIDMSVYVGKAYSHTETLLRDFLD
jgi:hypothetical protein